MSHQRPRVTGTPVATPSGSVAPGRGRRQASLLVLVLLCGAQLITVVDGTVVNVALPSISRAFAASGGDVQWIVTAYLLCTGGAMLLAGRLVDRIGSRRALLAGIAVFAVASLSSGLAPDLAMLTVARGAQGVGAALLSPAALSIITTTFGGGRQARALAAWSAVSASGFVAGLLIGGVLTTALGWRWIFFVNVPVSAVLLAALPILLPRSHTTRSTDALPLASAVTLTAGLAAIVYAISSLSGHGWEHTLGWLFAGCLLLAVFVAADRRAAHPMLAPALLRIRSLIAGSVLMFAVTGVLAGILFVTTFVIQQQLHASALRTGLDYLPFAVMIALGAHASPHLLGRLGTRVAACTGLGMITAGTFLLEPTIGGAGYAVGLLPAFLLLGAGTGMTLNSASVVALAQVPAGQSGAASGLLMTGHEAGGALGVAVLSALASAAARHVAGVRPATGGLAAGWQVALGHHAAFTVTGIIAAGLALLAAFALPAIRPPAGAAGHLH